MRGEIQNHEMAKSYSHPYICIALPVAKAQTSYTRISNVKDKESIFMEVIEFRMGYLV